MIFVSQRGRVSVASAALARCLTFVAWRKVHGMDLSFYLFIYFLLFGFALFWV